jgi:hypothetical protein
VRRDPSLCGVGGPLGLDGRPVHDAMCALCPSHPSHGRDPEAQDIAGFWPDDALPECEFVCAWRPTKLCRGNHDDLAATLAGRRECRAMGLPVLAPEKTPSCRA